MFVNFFIQRPIFSIVCSLIFVLGGIICIPFLPVAQYPEIAPAQISVTANYVGASSEVVESAVTTPLELEINGAEGVRYITSNSSNDGSCSITITIEPGRNADDAIVDIQNRVNRALARLPEEVRTAGITVQKNSNAFISIVGLYADKNEAGNSTYTNYFISNYADKYLKEAIKRIDGVGEVRIFGERKYSMRLWVDPNKMASRNITTGDLVLALREQNVQVAAGQIGAPPYTDGQMFQMSVKAESRLKDAKQFEEIIVKSGSSALVKVKDIGRVELGAESYSSILRFNGNDDVVGLLITQLPSANALDLDTKVKAELKKLSTTFPPGLKYAITLNPTDFVRESIQEVIHTLIEAILLVILVIFFFLQSFRSTLIPAITIPVSLIGTFIFVKIFGFSINTLTLFGLTLATGLVVDDAIVVLENITRFIQEKNMSPLQATFEGMKEITSAVIATSLVLVAVFIPVAFFPGSTGQLYKQFALTIAFSIGISAFNALTLTPALAALILSDHKPKEGKVFEFINRIIRATRNLYKKLLFGSFRHQKIVLLVFVIAIGLTGLLYQKLPKSFVPKEDQGFFYVTVLAPAGSSLEYTTQVMNKVEKVLLDDPDINRLFAIAGFSFQGAGPNKATLFPRMTELAERRKKSQSVDAVVERVRGKLMGIPEAIIIPFPPPAIRGLGRFGGFEANVIAENSSIDLNGLSENTGEFLKIANQQKELKGLFTGFTAGDPQLLVKVDREKAKSLGVDLTSIFSTLQVFLGSIYVNDFDLAGRIYKVYIQADKEFRSSPDNIKSFYTRSKNSSGAGSMIPLSNLLEVSETVSPQNITHFNLFRSAPFNGSAAPGFSSGQAIEGVERVAKQALPKGMSIAWEGLTYEQLKSGNQSLIIFFLGILFVFLILAAQYESFIDPFIILMAVPLAILGGLFGQLIRGLENDVFCQIGLVMLVGLASKNSILIVEYANQLRGKGYRLTRAITEAALTRFRPILMTSLAFILGVWPLVTAGGAGSASRHSLGTTVFGGMIVSTVLSLLVVPILYFLINLRRKQVIQNKDYQD